MITVLYKPDLRCVFHTLYPIVTGKYKQKFRFFSTLASLPANDENKILLIVRFFKERYNSVQENVEILKRLHEKYQKVVYYDDSDGADSVHFELIQYVDLYYKSQLVKDHSLFSKPAYGRQMFSEYYHQRYSIQDASPDIRESYLDLSQLAKLRVGWNLGTSAYPLPNPKVMRLLAVMLPHLNFPRWKVGYFPIRVAPNANRFEKPLRKIQARFSSSLYSASIGYQRKILLDNALSRPDLFLVGKVLKSEFDSEMQKVVGVLSPFGWGEVCFRDFECLIQQAILIKPDMSHVDTWPNIYQPNITYVPIDWNGDDLISTCERILQNEPQIQEIASQGKAVYQEALFHMDKRVESFIEDLTGQARSA